MGLVYSGYNCCSAQVGLHQVFQFLGRYSGDIFSVGLSNVQLKLQLLKPVLQERDECFVVFCAFKGQVRAFEL